MIINTTKKTVLNTQKFDKEKILKNEFINDVSNHNSLDAYSFVDGAKLYTIYDLNFVDIKINSVGIFYFFFENKGFKKDEFINKVVELKTMPVDTKDGKIKKINALLKIVSHYKIVFTLYINNIDSQINKVDIKNVKGEFLFIKKSKPAKKNSVLGRYFQDLGFNKLVIIFSMIAALIASFSIDLGIHNIYSNNAVYVFFLILMIACIVLNGFIYYDFFKKPRIRISTLVTSIVLNVASMVLGAALFFVYYRSLKELPFDFPSSSKIILIGGIIMVVLFAISVVAGFVINLLIKRKKSNSEN